MPTYFPQINDNMIITQLPYTGGLEYGTISQDMETGMRWSFSTRGNTDLDGYPDGPLGHFSITFPLITDAEVASLLTFFRTVKGKFHAFRLLDPGGNLIQYSEDFTPSYWDKTNGPIGIPAAGGIADPFGGTLASTLSAAAANSFVMAVLGPADGGINGFRVTVSVYVKAHSAGQSIFLGFVDSGFGTLNGTTYQLPQNSWKRISHSETLWDGNYFRVIMGGFGTWNGTQIDVYGFQVTPMKGEGAYIRSPGNYGYHQNVRFDTDSFVRQVSGPNQNSVVLPCLELNI